GGQQRRVQRNAGARGRSRNPFFGRALRTRDLEGRHPDLRQAGGGRLPAVARERRREEHRERQRAAQAGAPVVRVLRGEVSGRTGTIAVWAAVEPPLLLV